MSLISSKRRWRLRPRHLQLVVDPANPLRIADRQHNFFALRLVFDRAGQGHLVTSLTNAEVVRRQAELPN
jgi:hypothetical protein